MTYRRSCSTRRSPSARSAGRRQVRSQSPFAAPGQSLSDEPTDHAMSQATMKGQVILVTGGAGFVGSNLVKRLLEQGAAKVHIVDNLLSAERVNVPDDLRVVFSETSITDNSLLAGLADEYD